MLFLLLLSSLLFLLSFSLFLPLLLLNAFSHYILAAKNGKALHKNFRPLTEKSGCVRENDQQTGFYMIWTSVMKELKVRLTLYAPHVSESCIKIKVNLILLQVLPRIAVLNVSNTCHHCLTGKAQYTCHLNSTYVRRLFDV